MQTVVVGVDGSPTSERAVEWAAQEAELRGWPLRLVHAWMPPQMLATPGLGPVVAPDFARDELRGYAEQVAAEAAARVGASHPGVEVTDVVVESPSAQALIDAAGPDDLLVVGSRGRGGFAGLVLGSVSQQCAHHARCPVVIVRADED